MDIKDLKNKAERALSRIQGENEYNTKYVLRRLNSSLEKLHQSKSLLAKKN